MSSFFKHIPLAATQSLHVKRSCNVESSSSSSSSLLVWHFICNPADAGVDGREVEIESGKGPECHLEVYWRSQQVDAGVITDEWTVQLCDQSKIRVSKLCSNSDEVERADLDLRVFCWNSPKVNNGLWLSLWIWLKDVKLYSHSEELQCRLNLLHVLALKTSEHGVQ